MNNPDSRDKQIVRLLGKDGRLDSETLAKQLNLSSATVRRRLRKLIRDNYVQITCRVDPTLFGFPLAVVIALDVDNDKLESAVKFFENRSEVTWLSSTTGRFDVILVARFPSTDNLYKFITKELTELEGLRNSETFICLDVRKGYYSALP